MIFRSILLQQQWAETLLLLRARKQRRWWDGSKCKCCEYAPDEKMQPSRIEHYEGVQRTFTSQIPVQMWLKTNTYGLRGLVWSESLSLIQQQSPAIVRKEREVGGREVDGGSKVWQSFNGKRSLLRETWWKTRSTSILHNRSNSKHISLICPFWYTTGLFRFVKNTPKSVCIREKIANWPKLRVFYAKKYTS